MSQGCGRHSVTVVVSLVPNWIASLRHTWEIFSGKTQLKATCVLVNVDANSAGISLVIKFRKLRSVDSETKGRGRRGQGAEKELLVLLLKRMLQTACVCSACTSAVSNQ